MNNLKRNETTTGKEITGTTAEKLQQRTGDGHLGRHYHRRSRFGGHGARFGCDDTADHPLLPAEEHPRLELFLAGAMIQ